ncbi:hypothetical protein D3C72_2076480 [compost metagenome]
MTPVAKGFFACDRLSNPAAVASPGENDGVAGSTVVDVLSKERAPTALITMVRVFCSPGASEKATEAPSPTFWSRFAYAGSLAEPGAVTPRKRPAVSV